MIFTKLQVLSPDEIEKILEASYQILERTGCRFEWPEAVRKLEAIGAKVADRETGVVKFPAELLDRARREVPSLLPPDDSPKLYLPGANKGAILDYEAGQMRPGTLADCRAIIKLMNALPNITVASAGVVPQDCPADAADVCNTELLFTYSEKLFTQWIYTPESGRRILEMAEVVLGDKDELKGSGVLSYMLNPISPLRMPVRPLELTARFAELDLPLIIGPLPQACSTGPATSAGLLALLFAEFLAGLAFVLSLETKSGVALGAFTQVMELRSGRQLYASPEQTLQFLGAHQIARRLGYTSGNTSFETDSSCPDFQSGWEKAFSGALSWAAGNDMCGQAGFIQEGFSLEQLVLDNEAAGFLQRVAEGVVVNEETLAFEVIRRVGIGGHFLAEPHTRNHIRDFWMPSIFHRLNYTDWLKHRMTTADYAREKVKEILAKPDPEPQIDQDQIKELARIREQRIKEVCSR